MIHCRRHSLLLLSVNVERESNDQVQRDVKIKLFSKIADVNDNIEKVKKQINLNIEESSNNLSAKAAKNSYALDELKVSISSMEKRLNKKIDDKFANLETKLDIVSKSLETSRRKQEKDFSAFKDEGNCLIERISELSEKLLEFEQIKMNNLIFYGIPNDSTETHTTLNQKVLCKRRKK